MISHDPSWNVTRAPSNHPEGNHRAPTPLPSQSCDRKIDALARPGRGRACHAAPKDGEPWLGGNLRNSLGKLEIPWANPLGGSVSLSYTESNHHHAELRQTGTASLFIHGVLFTLPQPWRRNSGSCEQPLGPIQLMLYVASWHFCRLRNHAELIY